MSLVPLGSNYESVEALDNSFEDLKADGINEPDKPIETNKEEMPNDRKSQSWA